MNDSQPLLLDYQPNSHTRRWLILSGSWWSYLRNRSSQTVHASEWELVSHLWKSPTISWLNIYFLFLILLFTTATYSGSRRDKFIHPHSFKCKSHMKWIVLILNIATTAQTCIRLLEQAFKTAIHDYIYTHTHLYTCISYNNAIFFIYLNIACACIRNLDGEHLKSAMQ